MSKKNSNVILKENFKNYEELSHIYSVFKDRLNSCKNKNFLIAVSGGPDSLALTALAKSYSYKNKCKIYYVLVDHNLRKNSSNEAKSVKKLLKKHQINLNILKNKKDIKKNVQSEARVIRYNLLSNFCKKKKIKTIVTGHNLEDQVETFLIRLSRGSGLHGLSAMNQINKIGRNVYLLRPLLDIKKKNLINISKVIFRKFYKDPSNTNTKYLRTRVRNLKKSLEASGINYDRIFQSIKNLASSRDTLDLYFNEIYNHVTDIKKNKIFLNIKKLNSLNEEMKMRVFKKSIVDLTNTYYSPRAKKIFNLISLIKVKKNVKFTLGGCIILKEKTRLCLKKESKN
jgi:tRNA(Ile)-lysidine synthase